MFIFVFPLWCPQKNISRRQNMKDWTPLVLHVIHIVPEMCFGVVEIHVLKRENKACSGCVVVSLTGIPTQTSINTDIVFIVSGRMAQSSKSSVCLCVSINTKHSFSALIMLPNHCRKAELESLNTEHPLQESASGNEASLFWGAQLFKYEAFSSVLQLRLMLR